MPINSFSQFVSVKLTHNQLDIVCTKFFFNIRSADKVAPFPSIFFIGKNGTPIEIATGLVNTVDLLEAKINGVLEKDGRASNASAATASANLIDSE